LYDLASVVFAEEKELADCQQAEIEQLQRKVSELQGELKSEMKHSRAADSDAHVCARLISSLYYTAFKHRPLSGDGLSVWLIKG